MKPIVDLIWNPEDLSGKEPIESNGGDMWEFCIAVNCDWGGGDISTGAYMQGVCDKGQPVLGLC